MLLIPCLLQAKIVEDSNKVNELADLLREKEQLIAVSPYLNKMKF